jgi:hypothetical protein
MEQVISNRLKKYSKIPPDHVWDLIEKELDKMWPQTNGYHHPSGHSGGNNSSGK